MDTDGQDGVRYPAPWVLLIHAVGRGATLLDLGPHRFDMCGERIDYRVDPKTCGIDHR